MPLPQDSSAAVGSGPRVQVRRLGGFSIRSVELFPVVTGSILTSLPGGRTVLLCPFHRERTEAQQRFGGLAKVTQEGFDIESQASIQTTGLFFSNPHDTPRSYTVAALFTNGKTVAHGHSGLTHELF